MSYTAWTARATGTSCWPTSGHGSSTLGGAQLRRELGPLSVKGFATPGLLLDGRHARREGGRARPASKRAPGWHFSVRHR